MDRPYPAHWEADVVLRDGGTAHLRPIRPDDADRLVDFYAKTSEESKYFRFFSAYPRLSARDVHRFTNVDHDDRAALIALVGDEMIGVVRYDRVDHDGRAAVRQDQRDSPLAEVAFLVQDPHQGRGLGSVLLEHLAAAARERGVHRFVAQVLAGNRRMIQVFRDAGYAAEQQVEDGVLTLTFDLEPTETSLAVMQAREHRFEARSIERLVTPGSVAVIGASREPGAVGHTLLTGIVAGGFGGPVYPVNPAAAAAGEEVAGRPAFASVLDLPGPVDLAVLAVPAAAVPGVVAECGQAGVHGLVVVSGGFAETGADGRERQRELVRLARANGMRVVGPNCLGIVNTAPEVSLNATLAPILPPRGRVGVFAQSGALGVALLEAATARGLGLSTFVSAGNRADVSGNDLLQYWEEDPATDVVLLYLESFGNPRKFSRLARRVARRMPIVVVKRGQSTHEVPVGHAVAEIPVPEAAMDALFRQAGVIRVPTVTELFDVAQLVACQPLPEGDRVAILANSDSLGLLAKDACASVDLRPYDPVDLTSSASAADFTAALRPILGDPQVDAVIAAFLPALAGTSESIRRAVAGLAAAAAKPVVAVRPVPEDLPDPERRPGELAHGSLPLYQAPENAARALAEVVRYARWRRRPVGEVAEWPDVASGAARELVRRALGNAAEVRLDRTAAAELLGCYGIRLWPVQRVGSADEAAAAASRLGYPVALKALTPGLRHRADLGGVRLDLTDEAALREAFEAMAAGLDGVAEGQLAVQAMAARGAATVAGVLDDPSFGAVVSFGVAGVATELLGDRGYRLVPLTRLDASELIRSVRAAPLLFGYRGSPPVDAAAAEDLLLRLSRLAEELPEVAELVLDPVVVAAEGLAVLDGTVRLAAPPARVDLGPRALSQPG